MYTKNILSLMVTFAVIGTSIASSEELCSSESSAEECPMFCPKIYAPVCAYNKNCHETFPNKCSVKARNCDVKHKFKIVSEGKCEDQPCYNPICPTICNNVCTMEYNPICAYNDILNCYMVFSNQCQLDNYNCAFPDDYFVKQYDGQCHECDQPKCNINC